MGNSPKSGKRVKKLGGSLMLSWEWGLNSDALFYSRQGIVGEKDASLFYIEERTDTNSFT